MAAEENKLHRWFYSNIDWPQVATFSECGMHVVLQRVGGHDAYVESLATILGDGRISELSGASDRVPHSEHDQLHSRTEAIPLANNQELQAARLSKGIVRGGITGLVIDKHDGSLSESQASLNRHSQGVALQRTTDYGAVEELEILRLPSTSFPSPTILLPDPDDPFIKLIGLEEQSNSLAPPGATTFTGGENHGDVIIRVRKDKLKPKIRRNTSGESRYPRLILPGVDEESPRPRIWKYHERNDRYPNNDTEAAQYLQFERLVHRHLGELLRCMAGLVNLQCIVLGTSNEGVQFMTKKRHLLAGDMATGWDVLRYLALAKRFVRRQRVRKGRADRS